MSLTATEDQRPAVRVYASAVDSWLIALIYLGPVIQGVLGVYLCTIQRIDEALICLLIAIALVLLNLLLTHPCRYTLTADTLNLRCGMINYTIPLDRIRSAELSSSWLSGPALSLKRVRIQLDRGCRLVSPVDREQFITELMQAVDRVKKSA